LTTLKLVLHDLDRSLKVTFL